MHSTSFSRLLYTLCRQTRCMVALCRRVDACVDYVLSKVCCKRCSPEMDTTGDYTDFGKDLGRLPVTTI